MKWGRGLCEAGGTSVLAERPAHAKALSQGQA